MAQTKYKFRFSVFTATRNRANMLKRLYNELKSQTFQDFEWVLINDGSTDDTDEIVAQIKQENIINLQYVKKTGGGKHTAWLVATKLFLGQYIVTADDDDPITSNMLEVFNKHWSDLEQSPQYNEFWEVRSRCKKIDGSLVGPQLPSSIFDSDYNTVSYKMGIFCEMVGCRKVEVLRNEASVPEVFPFMENASNFDEAIRWSRAARKYKTRFVADITRIYNATPNSLSSNILNRCIQGEKRIIANKLVEFYFTLLERRDLLLKYNKRKYIKTILGYSFLIALSNPSTPYDGLTWSQRFMIRCLILPGKIAIIYKKRLK